MGGTLFSKFGKVRIHHDALHVSTFSCKDKFYTSAHYYLIHKKNIHTFQSLFRSHS